MADAKDSKSFPLMRVQVQVLFRVLEFCESGGIGRRWGLKIPWP